jgi:prepilin-type N-terminal cleavage/methylation domain-containing protein
MKRTLPASGFTLPEILVTIMILGVIGAVGGSSLFNIARRERANTVASELSGWLDQVNRDASRFNALVDSNDPNQTCTVTINAGNIAPGAVMASIAPAACATQDTLTVPDLYFNNPRANITANPATFVFTPRGTVATTNGAALPGGQVLISVTVNNERPLRCIRLVGLIGVLEVGRNNQAGAGGVCNQWSRV